MRAEELRAYSPGPHDDLARQTYTHLVGYVIHPVTRAPRGQTPLFDGVAELTWVSREDFDADVRSPAAPVVVDDLATFTAAAEAPDLAGPEVGGGGRGKRGGVQAPPPPPRVPGGGGGWGPGRPSVSFGHA